MDGLEFKALLVAAFGDRSTYSRAAKALGRSRATIKALCEHTPRRGVPRIYILAIHGSQRKEASMKYKDAVRAAIDLLNAEEKRAAEDVGP